MTDEVRPAMVACAECGVGVRCEPGPACWCAALPRQPMDEEGVGGLCPECLARRADRISGAKG
jgi:hypothetical protein